MNIDVYSPDSYLNGIPHKQFQWLRDNAPVYQHPHPDGSSYWAISKHADVMAVSRDFQTFSAERGFVLIDDLPDSTLEMARNQLLGMDPPRHAKPRRAVITRFTSSRLKALEPQIRAIAQEIMHAAQGRDTVNFVDDLAGDLPTAVICELMEIPRDMWPQIRRWSDMQTSASDPDLGGTEEEVLQASIEMGTYGFELACERKGKDGDDLISLLINQEVDGELISEAEFASLFVQIAVAGNETTRGLISSGMYQLLQQPELYRELEAQPEKLPSAVEEMLRWTCPLHYFRRTATCDTDIGGTAIKAGDKVVMLYSSANFDEAVFDQPMQFNIERKHNPHMAFGHGIHLCLGANLARMEARIFFEEFFKYFASIELLGKPSYIRSNSIHAFKTMPAKLLPR
ncbi:cytochrome P450 [Zhongshania antarctica]|uniref:Cytochrome P450 n=1 Tax=Zhongshania antarctica TaxID=641702 RepID=A0A840R8F5_9GAMM|nr:cytochrome P450 [Zhongshania antarctica]MBB5188746.1 cytochrome P450 [Zhongshania antarctica]